MKKLKRILALAVIAVMILSLAACGGGNSGGGESGGGSSDSETVKIGVISPRTGEESVWGNALYESITMLAEQTNEAGGILDGKQIEVISYDNRADVVESANATKKAITNDNVCAIIGTEASATTIAVVDTASEYNIPVVAHVASNAKVTVANDGSIRPYAFRVCLQDPQSGIILGQYAVNKMNLSKFAIIYEIGSDYCVGLSNEFEKAVTDAGGEVVSKEAYNTGDVDFRSVLTKIQDGPEFDCMFIISSYYKEAGLIAQQARDLGFTQQFLTGEGVNNRDIFDLAGDAVQGMVFNNTVDPSPDSAKEFIAQFTERWGYDPSENVGPDTYLAYDAYQVLIAAIERAGSTDPETIRDELEKTESVQGLACLIDFDPETHMVYRDVPVMELRDGDYVMLEMFRPTPEE